MVVTGHDRFALILRCHTSHSNLLSHHARPIIEPHRHPRDTPCRLRLTVPTIPRVLSALVTLLPALVKGPRTGLLANARPVRTCQDAETAADLHASAPRVCSGHLRARIMASPARLEFPHGRQAGLLLLALDIDREREFLPLSADEVVISVARHPGG